MSRLEKGVSVLSCDAVERRTVAERNKAVVWAQSERPDGGGLSFLRKSRKMLDGPEDPRLAVQGLEGGLLGWRN